MDSKLDFEPEFFTFNEKDGKYYLKNLHVSHLRSDGKTNFYETMIHNEIKKIRSQGGLISHKDTELHISVNMSQEQAKQELTIEAYAAMLLAKSNGVITTLWLSKDEEARRSLLNDLSESYNSWVQEELELVAERARTNPFNSPNVQVTELKEGEYWQDKI